MKDHSLPFDELTDLAEVQIWARRLAQGLVGDAHLAEDVVQDALVASMESRTVKQSPRAWLAGTIRHLAANARRDRARRRRREEVASFGEALPSAAETAGRLEAQEILIHALLGVDEPFRSALTARYVDGLAPRMIAKRDGVPVATVNSRLARGLDRLRASLRHRHGGDETRWMAVLAPLVPSIPSAAVKASSKAAATAGVLVMKKLLVAVAVVACLVPLGWRALATGPELDTLASPQDVVMGGLTSAVDTGEPDRILDTEEDPLMRTTERFAAAKATEVGEGDGMDVLNGAPLQTLTVLDKSTGKPVARAEVRLLPNRVLFNSMRPGDALFAAADWPASMRDFSQRKGRLFVTDASGQVDVPVAKSGCSVWVRKDGLHGKGGVYQGQPDAVVRLAPDRRLDVRVVDGAGRPMEGIAVSLQQEITAEAQTGLLPVARSITRTTEEDVLATLLLPDDHDGEQAPARWFVSADTPDTIDTRKEVFLHRWPTEPVTLELLGTGAVVVELLNSEETEGVFTEDAVVQLIPSDDVADLGASFFATRGRVLAKGRHRFSPVGAGVEVMAVVWPTREGLPLTQVGRGPMGSTKETTLTLDLGSSRSRVRGRVVDHHGAGVPHLRLQVAFLPMVWIPDGLLTDEEGYFEWHIFLDQAPYEGADFTLSEGEAPYRSVQLPADRMASALRTARSAGKAVELGDVVLPEPPSPTPTLAGRVITVAGEPVEGVQIHWFDVDSKEGEAQLKLVRFPRPTDAEGRFTVDDVERGPNAAFAFRFSSNHRLEPIRLDLIPRDDAGDLLIVVEEGSALVGEIVLEDGIPAAGIQVEVWPHASGAVPRSTGGSGWQPAVLAEDGHYRLEGLSPGTYSVRAGIAERHDDAALVEVEVGPGETEAPLINLQGLFALFSSRIVDTEGRPLQATLSQMTPRIQRGREVYGFSERLGVHYEASKVVHGTRPGTRILVEVRGYFPKLVDPSDAPSEIVMDQGFEVRLRVASALDLSELPGQLKVQLSAVGAAEGLPYSQRRALEVRSLSKGVVAEDGTVTMRVPAAGEYYAEVTIDYEVRSGYHIQRKMSPEAPFKLTIGEETAAGAELEVVVREDHCNSALDYVRTTFDAWIEGGTIPADLPFGEMYAD